MTTDNLQYCRRNSAEVQNQPLPLTRPISKIEKVSNCLLCIPNGIVVVLDFILNNRIMQWNIEEFKNKWFDLWLSGNGNDSVITVILGNFVWLLLKRIRTLFTLRLSIGDYETNHSYYTINCGRLRGVYLPWLMKSQVVLVMIAVMKLKLKTKHFSNILFTILVLSCLYVRYIFQLN